MDGARSSSRQERRKYLEELNSLRTKITALEKERTSHLHSKRHEFHTELGSLEETDRKLAMERTSERSDLCQKIEKIKANLNNFKRTLNDMKTGPAFAEKIKKSLEEIESSMMSFKVQQKDVYEQLLREERILTQEITAFEKRIDTWLSNQLAARKDTHDPRHLPADNDREDSLPPAVIAFERFLKQSGGQYGGWDQYDHQMFLKIRTNFQGKPVFLEAAVHGIPTHTAEEIQQHEQWYTEYLTLLESKKNAIRQWKTNKETARKHLAAVEHATEQRKQLYVTKQQQAKEKLLELERRERQSKLSDWKAAKRTQQKEEEKRRLLDEQHQMRLNDRERERREAIKKQVKVFSQQREEEARARELAEQVAASKISEQRRMANKHIRKFQEKDEQAIREKFRRKALKERKKLELTEKLERLKSQVAVTVAKDPSRLLQPTVGWEERRKAGIGTGLGGQLLSMPRRAVPVWRQGL